MEQLAIFSSLRLPRELVFISIQSLMFYDVFLIPRLLGTTLCVPLKKPAKGRGNWIFQEEEKQDAHSVKHNTQIQTSSLPKSRDSKNNTQCTKKRIFSSDKKNKKNGAFLLSHSNNFLLRLLFTPDCLPDLI